MGAAGHAAVEEDRVGRKTKGKPRGASFQPGAEASALGRLGARRRWGYCDHCNAYQARARGHRWAKMTHEPQCPLAIAEAARLAELAAEQARQEQERQAAEARRREAREVEAQRRAEVRARLEQARLAAEAERAAAQAERERRTHEPRCQCAPCRAYRLATL
jgi:hypothetical protein